MYCILFPLFCTIHQKRNLAKNSLYGRSTIEHLKIFAKKTKNDKRSYVLYSFRNHEKGFKVSLLAHQIISRSHIVNSEQHL